MCENIYSMGYLAICQNLALLHKASRETCSTPKIRVRVHRVNSSDASSSASPQNATLMIDTDTEYMFFPSYGKPMH